MVEFETATQEARQLLAQVPVEKRREVGAMPWYGAEYDLEDLIGGHPCHSPDTHYPIHVSPDGVSSLKYKTRCPTKNHLALLSRDC